MTAKHTASESDVKEKADVATGTEKTSPSERRKELLALVPDPVWEFLMGAVRREMQVIDQEEKVAGGDKQAS